MKFNTKSIIYVVAITGLLLGLVVAEAQSSRVQLDLVQAQINIASEEVGAAAESMDLETVHRHLQRTVNCLVGPIGGSFDLTAGNPCAGQGRGVMQDLRGNLGTWKLVDQALSLAKTGLQIEALGPARDVAKAAKKILAAAHQKLAENSLENFD